MEENAKKQPDGSFKYYRFNRYYALFVVAAIVAAMIIYAVLTIFVVQLKSPLEEYVWSQNDVYDASDYPTLKVDPDGSFRIMQISDVHLLSGGALDRKTLAFIGDAIDSSAPDLVIVTGDLMFTVDNTYTLNIWNEFISEKGVKWAYTFGNHDATGYADKTRLCHMLSKYPDCLFRQGPTNLADGKYDYMLGNYQINLTDETGAVLFSLVLMDSGERGKKGEGAYATFTDSQVKWYEWLISGTNAYAGKTVNSVAFFHIPLTEYVLAADLAGRENVEGLVESIHPSKRNSGIFKSMKRLNSTIAVFCGHDHQNTFALDYDGIKLCYGGSAGYTTYGLSRYKSVRLIDINAFDATFTTEMLFASSLK